MKNIILLIKHRIIEYYNKLIVKVRSWWLSYNFLLIYQKYKILLIILISLLLLIVFNHGKQLFIKKKLHSYPIVKADKAIKKDLSIKIYATGRAVSVHKVTVFPQVDGVLMKAYFKEGEIVQKEQLLFEIDPSVLKSEYDQSVANVNKANASLKNAELQFNKSNLLYKKNVISSQSHEQAIANLEIAKAEQEAVTAQLNASKIRLDFTKIYAPIAGATGELLTMPGTAMKATTQHGLVNINQLSPIHILFNIPEENISHLIESARNSNTITVSIPELKKQGHLIFFNNEIDQLNGNILLKAAFCNADLSLWPGQFVKLALDLKKINGAIVIPHVAVQVGQESYYVYVAELVNHTKNKQIAKIRKVLVQVGAIVDNEIIVTDGLKPDDLVVTEGYSNLIDQAMVQVYAS